MILPFDKNWADLLVRLQNDSEYKRFFRDFYRMLSFSEMEKLPEIMGCEVIGYGDDGSLKGFMNVFRFPHGIAKGGIMIFKDHQLKGLAEKAYSEMEGYLKRTGIRVVILEVCSTDTLTLHVTSKLGFTKYGEIPEYTSVDGVYTDVVILGKKI